MSTVSCDSELSERKFTDCLVCGHDLTDPRLLACLHTVCLPCLESYCHVEETSTGYVMICPECNSKTPLTETWMSGLPRNTFVEGLVKLKQASEAALKLDEQLCEVCCRHEDNIQTAATRYCVDCRQKLCERCSRPHKLWRGGGHKVVELGEEVNADILRTASSYCEQHRDEMLKMYCNDCKTNMCLMCFALKHRQHDCQTVEDVAVEFKEQMKLDVRCTRKRMKELLNEVGEIDRSLTSYRGVLDDTELEIRTKAEEMKKDIDKKVDELILKAQEVWEEKEKELASYRQRLKLSLATLENYVRYCEELSDKGISCDVTGLATDLHCQAGQLLKSCVSREPAEERIVCFIPFQHDMTTLVGRLDFMTISAAGTSEYKIHKTTETISPNRTPSPDPVSPVSSSSLSAFSTQTQRTTTTSNVTAAAARTVTTARYATSATTLDISQDQCSARNPDGKRKYSRQFLYQLQRSPLSRVKPESLPTKIDIVLTQPLNRDWSDCSPEFNDLICKYRFPFNAEQPTTADNNVPSSRASRAFGRRDHSRSKTPAKLGRDRYDKK